MNFVDYIRASMAQFLFIYLLLLLLLVLLWAGILRLLFFFFVISGKNMIVSWERKGFASVAPTALRGPSWPGV